MYLVRSAEIYVASKDGPHVASDYTEKQQVQYNAYSETGMLFLPRLTLIFFKCIRLNVQYKNPSNTFFITKIQIPKAKRY